MTTMKSSQTSSLAQQLGTFLVEGSYDPMEITAIEIFAIDRDLLSLPINDILEHYVQSMEEYIHSFPDYHDHTNTNVEARSFAEHIICTAFSDMMHGVPYGNLSKDINEWHTIIRVNEYPY